MEVEKGRLTLTDEQIVEEESRKILNKYDVEGLKEIINEFKNFKKSGLYDKIYNSFILGGERYTDEAPMKPEERRDNDLLLLTLQNLSNNRSFALKKDLITSVGFSEILNFIFPVYYAYLGRKINHEDVMKIYNTKINERLIFGLDKFDIVTEIPEPIVEYFQKIKKIKWQDKETKKFNEMLHKTRTYGGGGVHLFNSKLVDFQVREDLFIRAAAACSAVNDDRDKINMQDIIKAHKTYFKLLKTDLPALVDRLCEENNLKWKVVKKTWHH